ncbi:MAG: hypothetical protein LBF68_01255 [Christensenellaceae bacterium]|nr:hypothetical protein [Christensenellaceae bacterium]
MEVVIIVLFCITILLNIIILGQIFSKKRTNDTVSIPSELTVASNIEAVPVFSGVSQDIIAAITVAISVYLESESKEAGTPRAGFIVKSVYKTKK